MKKLLFLIAAVSTMLIGCSQQEDMSSPPADTNSVPAGGTTSTNQ
jgi:nitrous oxide reductase accessory protein NosL